MTSFATGRVIYVRYENWRGEVRSRRILPHGMRWGKTEWHPVEQWLIQATDLQDGVMKEFALEGFKFVQRATDQSLPWRETLVEMAQRLALGEGGGGGGGT